MGTPESEVLHYLYTYLTGLELFMEQHLKILSDGDFHYSESINTEKDRNESPDG